MKYITTERLGWLLAAGALTAWSLHFYKQFERPAVGLFEAAFGGWSVLPLSVVIATATVIMRKKAIDTPRFYEEGSGRYLLIALVMVASFGLILLAVHARP